MPKTTPSVIGPPAESVNEPAAPIEANPVREIAPNEAISDVQALSSPLMDGRKEFRIDRPHSALKSDGFGINGNDIMHPALRRVLTGRESTLLDLSLISGK